MALKARRILTIPVQERSVEVVALHNDDIELSVSRHTKTQSYGQRPEGRTHSYPDRGLSGNCSVQCVMNDDKPANPI